jgi:hypothetical protein
MRVREEAALIGWREYVELPEWGLAGIKAKVDTGARSSAIDVRHILELPGERVRFEIAADRGSGTRLHTVEAAIVRRSRVRSSFGQAHDRLFVATTLGLAGRSLRVELGLVSRENMLCRMLLGRQSLGHLFVVDPGRIYLHGRRKRARSTERGEA